MERSRFRWASENYHRTCYSTHLDQSAMCLGNSPELLEGGMLEYSDAIQP